MNYLNFWQRVILWTGIVFRFFSTIISFFRFHVFYSDKEEKNLASHTWGEQLIVNLGSG